MWSGSNCWWSRVWFYNFESVHAAFFLYVTTTWILAVWMKTKTFASFEHGCYEGRFSGGGLSYENNLMLVISLRVGG